MEPELHDMKHAAVWAAATLVASVAATCLAAPRAHADDAYEVGALDASSRIKVGRSGRVYVWRPGGC